MTGRDRRSFLSAVGALAGLAVLDPRLAAALPGPAGRQGQEWDFSWLDRLTGKHKQVFDLGSTERALRVVANYLDAFRDHFRVEPPEVNTVVGIAGSAFPINAGDALWVKYALGEKWEIRDPETDTWAVRNVFTLSPPPKGFRASDTVQALQARGAIFWQCNNALAGLAQRFAAETGAPAPEIHRELAAGLLPGVIVVPAHTMLIGLTQERGCTYERL
jgi:hypothetical protein